MKESNDEVRKSDDPPSNSRVDGAKWISQRKHTHLTLLNK